MPGISYAVLEGKDRSNVHSLAPQSWNRELSLSTGNLLPPFPHIPPPHPLALRLRHQAYSGFQVNSQVKMCLCFSKDQPEIYGWILAPSLG